MRSSAREEWGSGLACTRQSANPFTDSSIYVSFGQTRLTNGAIARAYAAVGPLTPESFSACAVPTSRVATWPIRHPCSSPQ
jgi:hypothetical protein